MANSLTHIVQPAFNHLDNNHALDKEQIDKFKDFNYQLSGFFNFAIKLLKNRNYNKLDDLVLRRDAMINLDNDILFSRIKILKKNKKGVKLSATYIELLSETKNLLLNVVQLIKSEMKLLDSVTDNDEVVK